MPLANLMAGVAQRMLADLRDTAEFQHRLYKGISREAIVVQEFLAKYLPGHVKVIGASEVADVTGSRSSQQDILIIDPLTPPLYGREEYQIVPNECVYASIEVKSKLTSAELVGHTRDGALIPGAWQKASELKAMAKTAYRPRRNTVVAATSGITEYGQEWPDYFPTASFVFAYDSDNLKTLVSNMLECAQQTATHLSIDAIFVLQKGMIFWGTPDMNILRRHPAAMLGFAEATEPAQVLIGMMGWLNRVLHDVWMPPFDMTAYVNEATIGIKPEFMVVQPTLGPSTWTDESPS